jgi:hypothetical protein
MDQISSILVSEMCGREKEILLRFTRSLQLRNEDVLVLQRLRLVATNEQLKCLTLTMLGKAVVTELQMSPNP